MTISNNRVQSCPRCKSPIDVGVRIEPYKVINGMRRWAHLGCVEASSMSYQTSNRMAEAQAAAARTNGSGRHHEAVTDAPFEGDSLPPSADALPGLPAKIRELVKSALQDEGADVYAAFKMEAADGLVETLRRVEERVEAKLAELAEKRAVEVNHTFTLPSGKETRLEGEVLHPAFGRVMRLALAGKPIFLPGPTGSGKTHLAMQLAKALGMADRFGMISCSPGLSESQLLGRSVPNIATGEEVYRRSEFVRIYEGGGVFLLDELDAADPSILLCINAALANGCVPVTNRPEKPIAYRHAEFVCVAAANTWGTGADRQYCGRNPLDEATLDRFRIGTVPCGYSEAVEKKLCPDRALYAAIKGWRDKMVAAGIKRVISSRFFRDAYDLTCAGDELADIELALFGGWRPEECVKVLGREVKRG